MARTARSRRSSASSEAVLPAPAGGDWGTARPVHQHGPVTEDDKTPLEHAVELTVLAPIGFVLEARRLLPSFVERGRQQVNMAKMVGQFAVAHGQTTAAKKLSAAQEQAEAILAEFGVGSSAPAPADSYPAPTAVPDPAPEAPAPAVPTPRSSAAAASLPIADYDSLAASQVIPRLDGLSADELTAVHDYEVAHRGRKTILGKITQLSGE